MMGKRQMRERLLIVGWVAIFTLCPEPSPALSKSTAQPIAFSHRLHVQENGLECVECHAYVKTQTFAGLPSVKKCLECHEEALTDSPDEEKIRQAAATATPLAWNRLYKVPDHVYYSHRRHVAAGKISCAECHGPIAETATPPPRALNEITMKFCMACHERTGITNDCIACHK